MRVLTRDVGRARGKLPYGRLEFFGPSDWQKGLSGATGVVNLAGAGKVVGRTAPSLCHDAQHEVIITRSIDAVTGLRAIGIPSGQSVECQSCNMRTC